MSTKPNGALYYIHTRATSKYDNFLSQKENTDSKKHYSSAKKRLIL